MHIKTVVIEGFKSYRNKTVVHFDRGLNVVVGLNGSGKSNLFIAIQFVLGNEFKHMPKRQRSALIHTSTALKCSEAYVELIFDNRDHRFPIGKPEVHLRRTVNRSKDYYTYDKKKVKSDQVADILRSAGLSFGNPYYIIKQGKITQLTLGTAADRLQMFKEISGWDIWKEKVFDGQEDLKVADEKIRSIGIYIERSTDALVRLNSEKEAFLKWKEVDNRKQVLSINLKRREAGNLKKRIIECELELEPVKEAMIKLLQEEENMLDKERELLTEFRKYELEIDERRIVLKHDEAELLRRKEHCFQLELELDDKQKQQRDGITDVDSLKMDLEQVKEEIVREEALLALRNDELASLEASERELKGKLDLKEMRYRVLVLKQMRKEEFKTREARDEWIGQKIRALKKQTAAGQKEIGKLEKTLASLKQDKKTLSDSIQAAEAQKQTHQGVVLSDRQKLAKLEEDRAKLQDQRAYILKEIMEGNKKSGKIEIEVRHLERQLHQNFPMASVRGWHSVHKVLKEMKAEGGRVAAMVEGYHCMLAERLDYTESDHLPLIETAGGNQLYYHIVDDMRIATEIIRRVDATRGRGALEFFALDSMRDGEAAAGCSESVTMLSHMDVDRQDDLWKVYLHIFGRILICKDIETCFKVATSRGRNENVTCMDIECDLVRQNGVMEGGYVSKKQSRLAVFLSWRSSLREGSKVRGDNLDYEQIRDRINGDVSRIDKKILGLEYNEALKKVRNSDRLLTKLKEDMKSLDNVIAAKIMEIGNQDEKRIASEMQRESLEAELEEDVASQLLDNDRREIAEINEEISAYKAKFDQVLSVRVDKQRERDQIESRIRDDLCLRESQLQQSIDAFADQPGGHGSIADLEKAISGIKVRVSELEEKILDDGEQLTKLAALGEETETEIRDLRARRHKIKKRFDREDCRNRELQEELVRVTARLAVLSKDDVVVHKGYPQDNYADLSRKQLLEELVKVHEMLKAPELANVNHNAEFEIGLHTEKLKEMTEVKAKLLRDGESIRTVIEAVGNRKDEAVQFTYKNISANFEQIFETLVPNGRACLNWILPDGGVAEGEDVQHVNIDTLKGVDIQACFKGKRLKLGSDLIRLSGGQKSLVSLALIFAILKLDRAPFYLFDEADMALDPKYRSSVASLVSKLAEGSQFIATTFKPELLPHADKLIGITLANEASHARDVTSQEAGQFVQP